MSGILTIDPSRKLVVYPDEIVKEQVCLINKFKEEKLEPNIRLRLCLVAEACVLLGKMEIYECELKTKALAVVTKTRLEQRLSTEKQLECVATRRITDGST